MLGVLRPGGTICLKYAGYDHFVATVSHHYDLLQRRETTQQYLEFSGVTSSQFETLSSDRTRPCKFIRLGYHYPSQVLLVKIMPGWDHEEIAGLFRMMIDEQLFSMQLSREFIVMQSPINRLGDWAKEPDICWAPRATSSSLTCVVEVGTSESASQLAIDARGWLETPGATVRAVLTISLDFNDLITIEVWELGNRASAIGTRNMPSSASRIWSIQISRAPGATVPTISGYLRDPITQAATPTDEIRLDFDMFVGRQAAGIKEGDVILTKDLLVEFAKDFWELRRQRQLLENLRMN
ncbi:uncharacterized protein CDV56_102405 [Aspergillus thermomutatus]|uniref:Uncharacterized protein n=1 Tax=Aspergillus thermomutatus TaxID=41047 RepID=A0A397GLZ5_ASPTH|nr:uncharacterized protein CDV56_102405 [Aspergillus thermomutatus]RHZ50063.1 hypothetical protein CDV56_102405 [Aspergillus thermomutatus]